MVSFRCLITCKHHTTLESNNLTGYFFLGGQNTFAHGCTTWSHTCSRAAYFLWSLCQQHWHGEHLTLSVQWKFSKCCSQEFFFEVFDSKFWICHHYTSIFLKDTKINVIVSRQMFFLYLTLVEHDSSPLGLWTQPCWHCQDSSQSRSQDWYQEQGKGLLSWY